MTLDESAAFEHADPHNARRVLMGFPLQCREAVGLRPAPEVAVKELRLVVIAGMGGSAAGGDLLASCGAERLEVPILVHRGYGLPAIAGKDTLVIACSYSGNTAEVLSAVEVALARALPVVVVTAGGKLADVARKRRLPAVPLPAGLMPRMALGYLFFPTVAILEAVGLPVATEADIAEALATVDALGAELEPARAATQNEAKRLALAIGPRLPAIYGGPTTGAVAYRWKTDFEENVKAFALAGTLPEMSHNELEAWRAPGAGQMHVVLLRDREESPDLARRFAVLRELIAPAANGVSEAWTRGQGRLARLLSLTYVGQWVSYYVAVLRNVDPWTVPLLDELKRRLGDPGEP